MGSYAAADLITSSGSVFVHVLAILAANEKTKALRLCMSSRDGTRAQDAAPAPLDLPADYHSSPVHTTACRVQEFANSFAASVASQNYVKVQPRDPVGLKNLNTLGRCIGRHVEASVAHGLFTTLHETSS